MSSLKKKGGALAKIRNQRLRRERVKELTAEKKEALVIAIDVSLSMSAPANGPDTGYGHPSRLEAAKDAARDLIRASLLSNVAIVSFSEHYDIVADFDHRSPESTLGRLFVQRGTLMNEALVAFEDLLTLRTEPVLRGILLSDGADYHGTPVREIPAEYLHESMTLPERLAREGIIVDCIGFGSDVDAERLTKISETTGGIYRHAEDAASLRRQFLRLEAGVRGLLQGGR